MQEILSRPLSVEEMRRQMEARKCVRGIVPVQFEDLFDMNLDEFYDCISENLTGSSMLLNASYTIRGHLEHTLLLEVVGDASEILEMEDEEEV